MRDSVFHARMAGLTMRKLMKDDEIEVPVQINGKTKAVISIPAEMHPKKMRLQQVKKAVGR